MHDKSPVSTESLSYFYSQILELKLLLLVSQCLAVAYWLKFAELSSNMAGLSCRGLWIRASHSLEKPESPVFLVLHLVTYVIQW